MPFEFNESEFRAQMEQKDTTELVSLTDYYFDQHAAYQEEPNVDHSTWDVEAMKRIMAKLRIIDKILMERKAEAEMVEAE